MIMLIDEKNKSMIYIKYCSEGDNLNNCRQIDLFLAWS